MVKNPIPSNALQMVLEREGVKNAGDSIRKPVSSLGRVGEMGEPMEMKSEVYGTSLLRHELGSISTCGCLS